MAFAFFKYISPAILHAVYGGCRDLMDSISVGAAVNTRIALSGDILGGMQSFRWGVIGSVKAVWSSLVNLTFRYCFSMGCFRLTTSRFCDLR